MTHDDPVSVPNACRISLPLATGEAYDLLLAWPETPAPAQGFPVLYVLDAEYSFGTVVEAVRMRSRRTDATNVTPSVVAGISLGSDRARQPQRRRWAYTEPIPGVGDDEGGAPAFRETIETLIKPAVAARVPVDPGRQALIGHSLAGRFVLDTLLVQPQAFTSYVAISPSVWWQRHALQAAVEAARGTAGLATRHAMIAVGEYEERLAPWQVEQPGIEALGRRREERRMVSDARLLAAELASICARVSFEVFPGEDHASVLLVAISRALRFCLAPATPLRAHA